MPPRLVEFGYSKYSQYGEDGIVAAIFEHIGVRSRICVEIGAWDGFHLSNVANLWTQGWKGVLIEADPAKFARLVENTRLYDCICVKALVTPTGPTCLEALLLDHGVQEQVDLLCIDVDGDDYYLFESLRTLHPRVVIVEYNPTIPADLDLHAGPDNYFGCSVSALVRLGIDRQYRLVALTDTNAFFVDSTDAERLSGFETDLQRIRIDSHLVYFISSYAGDYVLSMTPLFRIAFPYRGVLHGPHERVRFKSRLLELSRVLREARARGLRPLFRRLAHKVRGMSGRRR